VILSVEGLGFHRLTARKASNLLGVGTATLSYWRNGKRQPDVDSLMRLQLFFGIDSWALLMTPFSELLPIVADPERFRYVEKIIADGVGIIQSADEGEGVVFGDALIAQTEERVSGPHRSGRRTNEARLRVLRGDPDR
jgi:transcriptional regulator with XRE-family HTH domain